MNAARRALPISVSLVLVCLWACGGRTPLRQGEGEAQGGVAGSPPAAQPCTADAECGAPDACGAPRCEANLCVRVATVCDDADPCTRDACDPVSGCVFESLVLDADGDGHARALPGVAGVPSRCATDCDDDDPRAFPGAAELCDTVDNDCNGVVDDGAVHVPTRMAPLQFSEPALARATAAGITATPSRFVASYGVFRDDRWDNVLSFLDASGRPDDELSVNRVNADSYAGPVVFDGSALATVWEDARQDGNYEIYFARFDEAGNKLGPDVRVTDAPRFSLHPQLLWTGSEYLVVWDDRRAEELGSGELPRVYGQRLSAAGELVGNNRPLAPDESLTEFPEIALGDSRVAVVYVAGTSVPRLVLRVFNLDLSPAGQRAQTGENVYGPSVHWVSDRFIVLFNTYTTGPGSALWGAAFDANGQQLLEPRPITSDARFARSHDAVSLGDRLLVVWADDLHGNYDLFSQVIAPDLSVIAGRQRLTDAAAEDVGPAVSLGPNGSIAVVYTSQFQNRRQSHVLTLGCNQR